MSLYIQQTNQTYLWNSIHSHPKFQPHLRQYPPDKISAWFRSTIEGFYRNWGNRPMNEMELKQLNQNTVAYLYQSIVSLNSANQPPHSPVNPIQPQPPVQSTIQQQFQQHPSLPKPLPDFHGQHEFEQRAQEYQAMNAKPAAAPLQGKTDADQRESQDTMERRWLEQQRLREKDMEQFSPPSQINGPQAINLNLLKSTSPDNAIQEQPKEEKESIQLKIRELSENKERGNPTTVVIEKEPIRKPIREPIREHEPEWLKRMERIEQLQEKMAVQMEQMFQRLLYITPSQVENSEDSKIGDIDE